MAGLIEGSASTTANDLLIDTEEFGDEKRRIIRSRFAKRDEDGACKYQTFISRVQLSNH